VWLTDRSRYVSGLAHCPRYRYLTYHSGPHGYGLSRTSTSVPLATGTYIHQALADILVCELGSRITKRPVTRQEARDVINKAVEDYRKVVAARPLNGLADPGEAEFTADEQACLIEGLCWAWYRIMLPIVRSEFEIIDIEREESVVFACNCGVGDMTPVDSHKDDCQGICLMSRPDVLLRRLEDGKIGNHDFKTGAGMSDAKMEEWRRSIQMVMGAVGSEIRLGEKIDHFYMHALIKGSRGKFKKKGQPELPYRRTYSHLCYAKIIPPAPPATRKLIWSTKGYWYDKTPIWKAELVGKPAEMSNSEYWTMDVLDEATLNDCFQLVGPYERNDTMLESFQREIVGEETRWIDALWHLYEVEAEHPWDTAEFQAELERMIPRSYDCITFGSTCPMSDLCFYEQGWKDPLGLGRYEHRHSHHEPENEQMKARGVNLPLQPWEETDE
jgi:hypothetical protein